MLITIVSVRGAELELTVKQSGTISTVKAEIAKHWSVNWGGQMLQTEDCRTLSDWERVRDVLWARISISDFWKNNIIYKIFRESSFAAFRRLVLGCIDDEFSDET